MMKKFIVILSLIVVLTLGLTACNPAEVEEVSTETIPAAEEKTEEIIETEVKLVETTEEPVIEQVEETEATRTPRPTNTPIPPATYRDTNFPIGRFSSSESRTETLYLYADGSGKWADESGGESYDVDIMYGINGNLYSEMTFAWPDGSQVPVTYIWEFDGSQLIFIPCSEDLRDHRKSVMSAAWTYKGPAFMGTDVKEDLFPTGRFVSADGTRAFVFDKDGSWQFFDGDMENPAYSGKYVTNGDLYTEMTHSYLKEPQVPVTYTWTFDGENLTFELWGEDVIAYREGMYNHQTYTLVEEEIEETEIPEPTPTSTSGIEAGDSERILMVGDLERSYILHIPRGLKSDQAVGVVFVFHGQGGSPEDAIEFLGMNDIVDRSKLTKAVVVYPRGVGASWNAGEIASGLAFDNDIDESAFVKEILNDLESIITVDPKRIYATGFSQGGMLTYRLACNMSDTFAAIGSVSGSMQDRTCDPTQPVSTLHIHGLSDTIVKFSGGIEEGTSCDFLPVNFGIETWVTLNGCSDSITTEDDIEPITHTTYSPCEAGSTVELYTIGRWGHDWPDWASMTIWNFFIAHPMP